MNIYRAYINWNNELEVIEVPVKKETKQLYFIPPGQAFGFRSQVEKNNPQVSLSRKAAIEVFLEDTNKTIDNLSAKIISLQSQVAKATKMMIDYQEAKK